MSKIGPVRAVALKKEIEFRSEFIARLKDEHRMSLNDAQLDALRKICREYTIRALARQSQANASKIKSRLERLSKWALRGQKEIRELCGMRTAEHPRSVRNVILSNNTT